MGQDGTVSRELKTLVTAFLACCERIEETERERTVLSAHIAEEACPYKVGEVIIAHRWDGQIRKYRVLSLIGPRQVGDPLWQVRVQVLRKDGTPHQRCAPKVLSADNFERLQGLQVNG